MARNFPEPPKTEIQLIEKSPYKDEIFAKLLSGWSPSRVAYWLFHRYGKTGIGVVELMDFARAIPDEQWLEESNLDARFKGVDIEVDAVTEMHRLLRLAKDRLDNVLILEVMSKQQQPDDIEHRARVYWNMLLDFAKIAAVTGMLIPDGHVLPEENAPEAKSIRDVVASRKRIIAEETKWAISEPPTAEQIPAPKVIEGTVVTT